MKVIIPEPLLSYTKQKTVVQADGSTVAEVLDDLNRRFPGLRFRMIDEQDAIRPHMRIFVNGDQIQSLQASVRPGDEIHVLQALSGG